MNKYKGIKLYLIEDFSLRTSQTKDGRTFQYGTARAHDSRGYRDISGAWKEARPTNYVKLVIYERGPIDSAMRKRSQDLMRDALDELRRGMMVNVDGEVILKSNTAPNGRTEQYLHIEITDYSFPRRTLANRNKGPLPLTDDDYPAVTSPGYDEDADSLEPDN